MTTTRRSPSDYVKSPKQEYTGVYYDCFICGDWAVANGAIYKVFSDIPTTFDSTDLPHFGYINIGLDFGGNGSKHALCVSGVTHDMRQLYAPKMERIPAADMTTAST